MTSPLHGACLEECPQPHLQIAALQIHRELAVVAQCTTKALKVHTVSHLQHVFNGAGGTRAAIVAASNVHSSLGESNLIAQTAAMRPQTLLGLDLWVTSRVLFVSFNPVLGPSSYLPRSTFSAAQSASTVFPVGCCSIYTLTCLSSDFG